ncbi:MAG: primosomal protein N', partial [Solobacterium sp.]|nr:primosomal protein N' [Solobacterium sp.]
QCKVLLGSATPSLESYARALRKVYHLVEMKQRINDTLPKITLVPMKEELKKGGSLILSSLLKEKIKERLEKDQQIILLLNRRGFSTQLRCKNCEEILKCPHCDLALRYHRSVSRLICHACGTELSVPKYCPNCKSESGYMNTGFGTERLEDEVRLAFPEARILRMDADTTKRKNSHMKILKSFGDGEADILVGTQMIAKGLDYPKVTLVGVINGDEGIQRTDYRSCEITFDLLMQAGGRSGRAKEVGEVIYQVFDPDHYAIKATTIQDYDYFFNQEMIFRRAGQYPPYTYMISLLLVGRDKEKVEENAIALKDALQGNFKVIGIIQLLKIADLYRYRIILKGKDLKEMRLAIKNVIADGKIDVKGLRIDVNPLVLD